MKTTKQLARELGLLRERKLSGTPGGLKKRQPSQGFSYLVIIDFESTCWERDKSRTQEIIEFPAVLLDTKTGKIESEFHYYLQPQEHPTLSAFCHQLTGISQDQVDNGIPLPLCLRKFSYWLHKLFQEKKIRLAGEQSSTSEDAAVKLAAIVTWSDWDLGVCLHYELKRKQIPKAHCFNQWIDLRATYTKFYGRKPKGLNGALQDVGIEFEGRQHSGLHDSRNTAALAWRMIRDGCIMNITKSLTSASTNAACPSAPPAKRDQKTPQKKKGKYSVQPVLRIGQSAPFTCHVDVDSTCVSNSNLQSENRSKSAQGLQMQNPNIPHSISNNSKSKSTHVSVCSQKRLAVFTPEKNSNSKCMRSSSPAKSGSQWSSSNRKTTPRNKSSLPKFDAKKFQPDTNKVSTPNSTTSTKQVSAYPSLTSNSLPDNSTSGSFKKPTPPRILSGANVHAGSHASNKDSVSLVFTTSSVNTKQHFVQSTASLTNKRGDRLYQTSDNRLQESQAPVVQTLKTPSPQQQSFPANNLATLPSGCLQNPPFQMQGRSNCTMATLRTPPNTAANSDASFRTPQNLLMTSSSSMKATPPLCKCGRRAKRRMAQTPGPNMWRWFFSCVKGMVNPADSKASGCGFFQWEVSPRTVPTRPVMSMGKQIHPGKSGFVARPFTPVLQAPVSQTGNRRLGL